MPGPVDRAPVLAQRAILKDLLDNPRVPPDDDEARAHWAKYLCVLIAGYMEFAVRHSLLEHARLNSSETVYSYVSHRFSWFDGRRMSSVMEMLGRFSDDWVAALSALAGDQRGAAVTNVVLARHQVAHAGATDVTLEQLRLWFPLANEVLDAIADACDS